MLLIVSTFQNSSVPGLKTKMSNPWEMPGLSLSSCKLKTMKRHDFKDPFNGQRGCYHLSSSHLETQCIFRNENDFIFGINTLAILLACFDVRLIAYCLMDNHLHLLVSGNLDQCLAFYDRVVHRISMNAWKKYGITGILKQDDVDIVAVTDEQQLKNEICYIHRNPYRARIASPFAYRWSSADVYFNNFTPSGTKISSLSVRDRRRIFNTHQPIPDEYEFLDGRILNKSFVSFRNASEKFLGSVEYFDTLRKFSLESIVESSHGIHESITFSDSELRERIKDICKQEFHVDSHTLLSRKDLLRLAIQVRNRFGAGQAQLSRILGLDKTVLERVL